MNLMIFSTIMFIFYHHKRTKKAKKQHDHRENLYFLLQKRKN